MGRCLVEVLRGRGDEVIVSGRNEARVRKAFPQGVTCLGWDPASGALPLPGGVEGVINLAGESVFKGRWTKAKKERIRDSRVLTTRRVVEGMTAAKTPPKVLVNASAIGIYGDRKHNAVNEDSVPGNDFLARVCLEWEAEAAAARAAGIRTAIVRISPVLGRGGGPYALMTRPVSFSAA